MVPWSWGAEAVFQDIRQAKRWSPLDRPNHAKRLMSWRQRGTGSQQEPLLQNYALFWSESIHWGSPGSLNGAWGSRPDHLGTPDREIWTKNVSGFNRIISPCSLMQAMLSNQKFRANLEVWSRSRQDAIGRLKQRRHCHPLQCRIRRQVSIKNDSSNESRTQSIESFVLSSRASLLSSIQ